MELAQQGQHAEAAVAFGQAYALDPQPKYLFNQAQALKRANDCAAAVKAYDQVLAEPNLPPQVRERAQQERDSCRAAIAPPPQPPAPPPAPPPPPPQPVVPVPALPPPVLIGGPDDGPNQLTWFADPLGLTLLSIGVVASGVGTGLMIDANMVHAAATDPDEQANKSYADHEASLKRSEIETITGISALGVGGALLLGAATRFAVVAGQDEPKSNKPKTRISVSPLPGGLLLSGTF